MDLLKTKSILFALLILFVATISAICTVPAFAEDAKTLLKQANKDIRQAQKDMFAGKTDQAIETLDKVNNSISQAKALDPSNSRIKSTEKKYLKLVKDLERRTGKTLGGGTDTAAGTGKKTALPPKPKAKAMPTKQADAVPSTQTGTDALAKEASKLLRQAEKDMYRGKNQEAEQQIVRAKGIIDKLKAEDPKNSKISSLEKKYDKVHKKLEAKTAKAVTKTTAVSKSAAPKKKAPSSAKLPYAARKPLKSANQRLSGVDGLITDLADPNYPGDKDQLVERLNNRVTEARQALEQAKALAAQKGVTSHPDFEKVEAKLAEADNAVAQAKGGYKEAKAAAAAKSEEVGADVKKLHDEYERVKSAFSDAGGTAIYYNDLEPVEQLIVQIEGFEKNDLDTTESRMHIFSQKYGTTREEIDKKAESMGYSGNTRASFAYTELKKGIEGIKKTRVVMAEDLIKKLEKEMARAKKGAHDFYVVELYGGVRTWLQMASRYDSENPKVKEAQANLDQRITNGMREFHAKIDKRTWPKHAAKAPQNAKKLAKIALDWFKDDAGWGEQSKEPRKPLAVVVIGPWSIQAKNILGEIIMYGLPVLLAVEVDRDKELNVARVYSLTMRTVEKRDVKMAPPFDHVTVGNSYFIRQDKVK